MIQNADKVCTKTFHLRCGDVEHNLIRRCTYEIDPTPLWHCCYQQARTRAMCIADPYQRSLTLQYSVLTLMSYFNQWGWDTFGLTSSLLNGILTNVREFRPSWVQAAVVISTVFCNIASLGREGAWRGTRTSWDQVTAWETQRERTSRRHAKNIKKNKKYQKVPSYMPRSVTYWHRFREMTRSLRPLQTEQPWCQT